MDTLNFIPFHQVPSNKVITYTTFTCNHHSLKLEPWHIQLVVGRDKLPYSEDVGSPATDLLETKLLFNSVISDAKHGARFMSLDLKDMFLMTPMENPKYMKVPYKYFPHNICCCYDLDNLLHRGYIYIKIKRGMYGLKQGAELAYEHLSGLLNQAGYHPILGSMGMWTHSTHQILFNLCIDDFGVKYYNKEDVHHLIDTIQQKYQCKCDWEGKHFLGFTLE